MEGYASDVEPYVYNSWSLADLAVMTPAESGVASALSVKPGKPDGLRVVRLQGFLEAPRTGKYRFYGHTAKGAEGHFQLLDAAGHFTESEFALNEYGGMSTEVFLAQGKHPIELLVVQGAHGRDFDVRWEGPGIARGDVSPAALSHLRQ